MAALEVAVIVVLGLSVAFLSVYSYYLRFKLMKAAAAKRKRGALARDLDEKLRGPWEPSLTGRAAWKLAFSLVHKSLQQAKYKRMQARHADDDKEQFIEGIVHEMIDRALNSIATHGGRLRQAGELAKAFAKRRGLRRLQALAAHRRTLRLQRRNGQLAGNAHHVATTAGTLRSVAVEMDGGASCDFPLRPGTRPRTGPLGGATSPGASLRSGAGPPLAARGGPGQREADRYMSLNASDAEVPGGDESASLLRAAAVVPGQLPDEEDDDEIPVALRNVVREKRSRGAIWLAEQGRGHAGAGMGSLVVAFGDYQRGQLGVEPTAAARQVSKNTIVTIEDLRGCEPLQVEASGVASLVVGSRGQVWGFGSNRSMELGARKEIAQVQAPQRLKSLRDIKAVQVASSASASGQAHTLALAEDGHVYTFGTSSSGALAQGQEVRQTAPLLLRLTLTVPIRQVAAGARHSLLITDGGEIFAVGDNSHGQLGHGKRDPANAWSPKFAHEPFPVEGELANLKVRYVATGDDHNLVTTEDGRVFAWGANSNGQLGLGRVGDQATPVPIREFKDADVTSMACGARHSLVVSAGGKQVWSFGSNVQGQLGLGQSSAADGFQLVSPTLIPSLRNQTFMEVVQVAAAGCHSMAVTKNGELWAWGDNAYGQLGFPKEGQGHRMSHAVASAAQAARPIPPRNPPRTQPQQYSQSRTAIEVDAPRMFAEGVARLFVPVKVVSLTLYRVISASTSDLHTLVVASS